jgi:hypothetical protein
VRPAYDLRVVPISEQMLMVELAREHAPCAMYCRFCPRTANHDPRDLPAPTAEDRARVLADFRRLLETMPTPDLFLWSDDLLRYPGVFELLDAAKGHRLHVVTPGLELADRAFAERFKAYDLRFDLTIHALDEPTFTAMCGNPAAHALVLQAVANLAALQIRHQLAVVVTERNVHALGETVAGLRTRFGADRVYVRLFYPDALHMPPGYERQFPAFDDVVAQLARAEALSDDLPVVFLSNAPPCQVALQRLERLRVFLTPHFNAFRAPDLPACAACPAADVCPRLHPAYGRQHAAREPDLAQVRAVLDHVAAQPHPDLIVVERPPVELIPLGEGAELVVEDLREDRRYWFRGPQLGVWCRADGLEPARRTRLDQLLAKVKARLDRLPAERVSLDDLRRLGAWVRGTL